MRLPKQFRVEREIGRGAFAAVFECLGPTGERLAVKVPLSGSSAAGRVFRKEIDILRVLGDQPNVATYRSHGLCPDGRPWVATEYIEGYALAWALEHGDLASPAQALHILLQLCGALAELHRLGAIHGDIKPANVMIDVRHRRAEIYDIEEGVDPPFMALELMEGRDLARVAEAAGGTLDHPTVLPIAGQLCAGLDYLHSAGLVHADLKPGNAMMTWDGRVKILDFGLVRAVGGTQTQVMGTPAYMSPEQMAGKPLDRRSDIYSLGALLLRLTTGRTPMDAGGPCHSAIAWALSARPQDRPETAGELYRALSDGVRG